MIRKRFFFFKPFFNLFFFPLLPMVKTVLIHELVFLSSQNYRTVQDDMVVGRGSKKTEKQQQIDWFTPKRLSGSYKQTKSCRQVPNICGILVRQMNLLRETQRVVNVMHNTILLHQWRWRSGHFHKTSSRPFAICRRPSVSSK